MAGSGSTGGSNTRSLLSIVACLPIQWISIDPPSPARACRRTPAPAIGPLTRSDRPTILTAAARQGGSRSRLEGGPVPHVLLPTPPAAAAAVRHRCSRPNDLPRRRRPDFVAASL